MKTRKRALVGLTVALALFGTAACGRAETTPGDQAPAQEVTEGAATGTLTVWAMGVEGEELPGLVEGFKAENPDVTVNVTAVPWDSAHDRFTAAIAAGTTPDVAQVGTTWMGEFVGLNALDPTPDLIDPSMFFEGAQSTTEVDGTSYAVPWYVETRLLYYRTDIAEAAGITEAPATWDDLKAMATAMKGAEGVRWPISLLPGGTGSWQTVLPLMWSNGGQVVNDDQTAFTFDTPENVEALQYYQSFFTEGLANTAPTSGTTEADFVSGAVPMFISGPWMMSSVENLGGEGFADQYAVAEMPTKVTNASFIGGSNLAVFSASENRDAAWKLVDYLTQEETQIEWFDMTSDLPSVQSAWDDAALQSDEKLATFGAQLETAYAPPAIQTWEQVANAFDAEVERVTITGSDAAAGLSALQQEATSIGMG
ncbi:sugar ABC transporter substrate-binding protein [Propioniciclava soli]|uniref:Sugar ABC transporter substrate-binding protein n=1 Tax=Propioniciclava soli TaxID=2775081 RepID=A0ABZ3C813_9ACTN